MEVLLDESFNNPWNIRLNIDVFWTSEMAINFHVGKTSVLICPVRHAAFNAHNLPCPRNGRESPLERFGWDNPAHTKIMIITFLRLSEYKKLLC